MAKITPIDADRLSKRIVAHHSFPGASHAAIERVLGKGECTDHPHGTTLCAEGEPGDEMFFLVSGNITVLRKDIEGVDRVLSDMTCPCVFGHMSVIDGSKRSATCKANGPVQVVTLRRSAVDQLISEGSVAGVALRRLLIASLCDQLSSANGFVRKIVSDHIDGTKKAAATPHLKPELGVAKKAPRKATRTRNSPDEDLRKLTAKLGGWDNDLEEIEKEIELVMDEDQKRTVDARRRT